MPATSRISLSSPGWRGARSNSFASTMPSETSRRTVRRSRSTVQVEAVMRFRTRTTSPQGWAGRIRRTVGNHVSNWARTLVQMCRVAAGADLADGVRVAGAQAGIAADTTAAARRPQPGLGALGNQRPFELGDGTQHLQREHALWRGGVDRVAQAAEMRASGLELLDDGEEMADRAGEAIEPDHDQGFAGADLVQQARQHRPAAVCAGGVLLEHRGAAGRAQFVELRIGALFLGRDPRIANQTAWRGGFRQFCRHELREPSERGALLQINKTFVNGRLQKWPKI